MGSGAAFEVGDGSLEVVASSCDDTASVREGAGRESEVVGEEMKLKEKGLEVFRPSPEGKTGEPDTPAKFNDLFAKMPLPDT